MPGVKFSQFLKGGAGKFGDQVVGLRNGLNTIFDSMPASGTFSIVNQVAHGFSLGQIVYHDGVNYKLATATLDEAEVIGCVATVIDPDTFQLITHGLISTLENLIPGTTYFLSDTVPGLLTEVEPTTPGFISKPLLLATKIDEALFNNFRGKIIPPEIPPPGNLQTRVHQLAHGFNLADILRFDGLSYSQALADNEVNAEVVGMVGKIVDADNFILFTHGLVTFDSPLALPFTPGTTYFLSDVNPGFLSAIEPTFPDSISKPLFIALSPASGYFYNLRGKINPDDTPVRTTASRIIQAAHGFTVGQALYYNGGQFTLALADTVAHAEAIGVVSKVDDTDTFDLTITGYFESNDAGFTNFVPGATYFLSDTTPGRLSLVEPTQPSSISKPMFLSTSPTSGYIFNLRGQIIPKPPFAYQDTSVNTAMVENQGYITSSAALTVLTLPTQARYGSIIKVAGFGAGGWKIAQQANQQIHFLSSDTTQGVAGYLQSTQARNTIELVCVVADLEWLVTNSGGNITII